MPKLDSLDFSTPNNACLSLRTLAEWARAGDVIVEEMTDVIETMNGAYPISPDTPFRNLTFSERR